MTGNELILAALVVPLLGGIFIALCARHANLREAVTLATSVLLFICVALLLPAVLAGARPQARLLEPLAGLRIAFQVEPLGMLFALIASGLWIVNSVYSIGYMRGNKEAHQTRFYVCFALALTSAIGVAFAANLITLLLFYEALTLVTYPLVTHHGTDEAKRGGRVYLALLVGTSVVFLLPAIVFTWHVAGTTDFRPGGILTGHLSPGSLAALLALFMFGIGKAALMPFHRWLPAAMVAPTPVSALLHAVAVVKAGVFSVIKILVYVFGLDALVGNSNWLVAIAGFTILAASVVALRADNLKRRLAYSTVSQLAYVVLATALLAPLSVVGAVFHVAAHALGKITLFFAAGSIYTGRSQDRGQPARWHRQAHAVDHGRIRDRCVVDDRAAAGGGLCQQVVHALRGHGSGPLGGGGSHRRQHPAQRRLFPPHRPSRIFPPATAGGREPTARRGTASNRHRPDAYCNRYRGLVLCARGATRPCAPDAGDTMSPRNHWLDEPRNVKRLWRGFIALPAAMVIAEFFISLHPHFDVESLPAFYAAYGFLACAAMIVLAKALGVLLKRPDTYYSADDE